MKSPRRLVGVAVVVVALSWLDAGPVAHAQSMATGRIQLASQTAAVGAGGDFVLGLDIDRVSDAARLDVAISIYRSLRNRSEFTESVAGRQPRGTLTQVTVPLGSLAVDESGERRFAFRLGPVDPSTSTARPLPLLAEGVYPVEVELRERSTRQVVDDLVTHLVRIPDEAVEQPLRVAWVQAIAVGPSLRPDSTRELSTGKTQDIARLASGLTALRLPVNVQLSGESFDGLPAVVRQAVTPDLRTLVTTGQLIAGTYSPVDVSALAGAGLGNELPAQREHGDAVTRSVVGADGDPRTWVSDTPLTTGAVRRLRELGITRVVVPEVGLRPLVSRLTQNTTLTSRFLLAGDDGATVDAVAADPGLQTHFSIDDPVLGAHRLLADLAVLFQDAPGRSRGVILQPPVSWKPDTTFLQTLGASFDTTPTLRATTLDAFFAAVPAAVDNRRPVVRETTATAAPLPGRQILEASAAAASLATLAGPGSEAASLTRRLVLIAEGQRLGSTNRQAYLDAVLTRSGAVAGAVRVVEERHVRLTAREGRIPLTVVNENPFPVQVRLDLSAEKLEFTEAPAGDRTRHTIDDIELKAGGRRTLVVQVRARTSARFKLRTTLRSPVGEVLSRSEFTVTSTALSGVGVVLSAGALLFLVVWWIRNWRRSRHGQLQLPLEVPAG